MKQANESEANRLNFLRSAPLPKNDPVLFTPVRCKVLKSFCVAGKPTQPDEIVSLPWHLAMDMLAIKKVELI